MLNTTESLPLAPAAAEQDASLRRRGWAIPSKPETGPHAETPLSASPSSVLHERTTPRLTVTEGGSAGRVGAIGAVEAATEADAGGDTVAARGALAEAGASARAATAEGAASAGTDGPSRTPASRGQATPITKPMAAMIPTLTHGGRSSADVGRSTTSGIALRTF